MEVGAGVAGLMRMPGAASSQAGCRPAPLQAALASERAARTRAKRLLHLHRRLLHANHAVANHRRQDQRVPLKQVGKQEGGGCGRRGAVSLLG